MIQTKEPIHTNNGSVFMLGEDGKKIKAISCELSAASQLFFYDLNHYDKRVFSIALRAPAAPSDGGRSGITRSDDEGSLP